MSIVPNWKLATQIIMGVCGVALVGWDIFADTNKTTGDTISEIMFNLSRSAPILVVICGVVCGHLFTSFDTPGTPISLFGSMVLWLQTRPIFAFMAGMAIGSCFWYQQANFK
jgi:hypothetical protein